MLRRGSASERQSFGADNSISLTSGAIYMESNPPNARERNATLDTRHDGLQALT